MKNLIFLLTVFIVGFMQTFSQSGWVRQNSPTTNNLWGVSFATSNNRIAVGEHGTILRTRDAGRTWTVQTSGTSEWLLSVQYINSRIAVVAGWNGVILTRQGGGISAARQILDVAERLDREAGAFVDAAGAGVGLKDVEDKYPNELSDGMKKRVAIARGLVIEPQLLLYDEPTSELDPLSAVTIAEEILNLKRQVVVDGSLHRLSCKMV